MAGLTRREFLKTLGVAAAAAVLPKPAALELKAGEGYGILVDTSRCIGCKACQIACKQFFDIPAEIEPITSETRSYQHPKDLSGKTWTVVKYYEKGDAYYGEFVWQFLKWQCLHCIEPPCVEVCPAGALIKTPEGPVIFDPDKCIGCQWCKEACPFGIPRYDDTGAISKCRMCFERIQEGEEPACVKACITDALVFGKLSELKAEAEKRAKEKGLYIYPPPEYPTSVIYLLKLPPEELGLPKPGTPKKAVDSFLRKLLGI